MLGSDYHHEPEMFFRLSIKKAWNPTNLPFLWFYSGYF